MFGQTAQVVGLGFVEMVCVAGLGFDTGVGVAVAFAKLVGVGIAFATGVGQGTRTDGLVLKVTPLLSRAV